MMTEVKNYRFHSTQQFRNVVKSIKDQTRYVGYDEEKNEPIFDNTKVPPSLTYIGTTKLHGTNSSIVIHESGVISFHSKSQLLGYVEKGEFTLNSDNAEFAQTMWRRIEGVNYVVDKALDYVYDIYGEIIYPIKLSGEWAGSGIQKGVGISYLPNKSLFLFGMKVGDNPEDKTLGWQPVLDWAGVSHEPSHIYNITDFPYQMIKIDFSNPEYSQNLLVEYTENVEEECPVSKQLQTKNSEGELELLGEGLVWTPQDFNYCRDSGNHFKTKGQKHSVSKVKSVAAIDPEKLSSIKEFVDYSVTENRLQQGVTEVGLDQKKIGQFIGWVNKDINKEEGDTLEASNLTMKEIGKYTANKAREFYLNELNNF